MEGYGCRTTSIYFVKARGSLLCGSLAWDNRRIKQRLTLLNSAGIAPKHCFLAVNYVQVRCLFEFSATAWIRRLTEPLFFDDIYKVQQLLLVLTYTMVQS
jgi:hypothetical protein